MKNNIKKSITKVFLSFIMIGAGTVLNAQTLLRDALTPSSIPNSMAFIDGSSSTAYNGSGANYAGKGILFPSMDLTLTLSGAPFDQGATGGANYNPNFYDGLVVFNIGTGAVTMGTSAADVAPGFYYYRNTGSAWNMGVWIPMSGESAAGTILDNTPMTSELVNGVEEKVIRLTGTANGTTTHIDLGTTVLAAGAVGTFRKAQIYDVTTGAAVMESTGSFDTLTNIFVTSNGIMNFLLDAGSYTVELYYFE